MKIEMTLDKTEVLICQNLKSREHYKTENLSIEHVQQGLYAVWKIFGSSEFKILIGDFQGDQLIKDKPISLNLDLYS